MDLHGPGSNGSIYRRSVASGNTRNGGMLVSLLERELVQVVAALFVCWEVEEFVENRVVWRVLRELQPEAWLALTRLGEDWVRIMTMR